jgi:hypothetical protein
LTLLWQLLYGTNFNPIFEIINRVEHIIVFG